MDGISDIELSHRNWREAGGRVYLNDQTIYAGEVFYIPVLDSLGRVGYEVRDHESHSEYVYFEPSPNRKERKLRVFIGEEGDGTDPLALLLSFGENWTFDWAEDLAESGDQGPVRLVGDAIGIDGASWQEADGRVYFHGQAIMSGAYIYVPFIDRAGRVGYALKREQAPAEFVYFNPSDGEEDRNVFVYGGQLADAMDDQAIVFLDVADWDRVSAQP